MLDSVKISFRSLAKTPGFTLVAILTLAVGIGANTALFSVIHSLLFRPLPLREVDRLVFPVAREQGEPYLNSPAEYDAWRSGSREHVAWGAAVSNATVLAGAGEPRQLRAAAIDAGYLATLGVTPAHGRSFTVEECATTAPVTLLTHGFWQDVLGGSTSTLGQSVQLDNRLYTVVGILPPGFDLPIGNDLYVPWSNPLPGSAERPNRGLFVVARLSPAASLESSDAELKALSAQLSASEPAQKGWSVTVLPLRRQLLEDINGGLGQRLLLLFGAVACLLLVACANVGNLILARTLGRVHELAIRSALGASRGRLVRQLLGESALIAMAGSGGGWLLAVWLTPVLMDRSPVQALALANVLEAPSFSLPVLVFTVAATLLTTLIGGLPAALRASNLDLNRVMRTHGGRGSSSVGGRWRDCLVVGEIALCLTLLAGAALLSRSFLSILNEPLGFHPDGVLSVRVAPPTSTYPDQPARARFADAVLERVRSLPGVRQAGIVTTLPLHLDGWSATYRPETGPYVGRDTPESVTHRAVTPGYMEAMGMQLRAGRFISPQDTAQAPLVVVVTEDLAKRLWPGEDPLGKRLLRPRYPDRWITVVGVIAPVKEDRVAGVRGQQPAWYLSYAQTPFSDPIHIVVKTTGDPALLSRPIRDAVQGVDPKQPVYEVVALQPYVDAFLAPERFAASLLVGLAGIGLLLALLGIFGVNSYIVGLRTREIAIRLALGESPRLARNRVLHRSLAQFGMGAGIGLVGILVLGRIFGSVLHNLPPHDPLTLGAVTVILGAVAVLATWIPAQRAARVNPIEALRAE